MTGVVTDISFAFKWIVEEDDSAAALAMLLAWQQRGDRVLVPCWFACELANALHQQVRGGKVTADQSAQFIRAVLRWVTVLDPDPEIAVRGMQIAAQLGQRASYDAQYLALAERLGYELWTADRRFALSARPVYPFVHWLGQPA